MLAMIRALAWIEDFFDELPIKHALIWSPAIGALILGVIGYFYPQVFGTGYDTIRDMLNDRLTTSKLLGISVAKRNPNPHPDQTAPPPWPRESHGP
jgi:H+/Cl- antiporter ClcA